MALIKQNKAGSACKWMVLEVTETEEFYSDFLVKFNINHTELNRISHPKKRLEWLASRYLLCFLLDQNEISFTQIVKNNFGKPSLLNSPWHISISHTVDHVAACIHPTKPVGIDLENTHPRLLMIREKFLNEVELAFCDTDIEKLCIIWSAKEALYKLYGQRALHLKDQIQVEPFDINAFQTQGKLILEQIEYHYTIEIEKLSKGYLTIAH